MPLTKVTGKGVSDLDELGVGTSSPSTSYGAVTQIHDTGTAGANLRLTDANSGSGTGNGFEIIQIGANNYLINRENGFISIYNNGYERLRILSGGGLTFNGDTATANALDDYEEGTFTASFNGSTSNPTISYSAQVGTYVKVGKLVHITVSVIASGTPSGGGGNLRISGLPFTSKSGVQQAGKVAFTNNLSASSGTTEMSCNIEESDSVIHLNEHEYSGTSSMNRMQVSALHNSSPRIVCSIAYETA